MDASHNLSPLCPLCNTQVHDTTNLFMCAHVPTHLTVLDLWTNPMQMILLLNAWKDSTRGKHLDQRWTPLNLKGEGVEYNNSREHFFSIFLSICFQIKRKCFFSTTYIVICLAYSILQRYNYVLTIPKGLIKCYPYMFIDKFYCKNA